MSCNSKSYSKKSPIPSFWIVGFSIFAMFFGAGNIIFPLSLGLSVSNHLFLAFFGLFLTAVVVPLLGFIAMAIYNCNYRTFFNQIGTLPGFIIVIAILGLIGPIGGIPRAMNVSHGVTSWGSLPVFVTLSSILMFIFSYKPSFLLSWMGNLFSPLILIILFFVITKGLFFSVVPAPIVDFSSLASQSLTPFNAFWTGFVAGFNTMDLLASFFFSTIVVKALQDSVNPSIDEELALKAENKNITESKVDYFLVKFLTKASCLSAFLLASFYLGFFLLAAKLSLSIENQSPQMILRKITEITLGKHTIFVTTAIFLACFTTQIALAGTFAQFLSSCTNNKLGYMPALAISLLISWLFSLLKFEGISLFLVPILKVIYPSLIVLCIVSILQKIIHFKYIKTCFYTTLVTSLLIKLLENFL